MRHQSAPPPVCLSGTASAAGESPVSPAPASRAIVVIGLAHPTRGGIAHYSTMLVRALRRFHSVRFITVRRQFPRFLFPGRTELDESAQPLTEAAEPLLDGLDPRTWLRVARGLEREAFNSLIIQSWNTFLDLVFGVIVNRLPRGARSRVCIICHNVRRHESTFLDSAVLRWAYRHVGSFVVHSRQDEEKLNALFPGTAVRVNPHPTYSVFKQFGDCDKARARAELGIAPDERVVLFFGVVRKYKGLRYLIEAMKHVLDRLPCRLLIVGEFYEGRARYEELIDRLSLRESVTVVGRYVANEEVPRYFYAADTVALPYVQATQSGVLQIAFGLGCPVIATKVGGIPEVVRHGETGFLVEPRSGEALADAIVEYFLGEHEQSFRAAIDRESSRFEWDVELGNLDGAGQSRSAYAGSA